MASSLQKSVQLCLGLLVILLGILRFSNGHPTYFKPSKWNIAHATFYGDDTASATMGGACGYGDLFKHGYGADTAAVSPELFNNGNGCGSCYQVMCVNSKWCNVKGSGRNGYGRPNSIIVTATNLGPPDWVQASDAGSWHNLPRAHFDLSLPAFKKIASPTAGIIPLQYRRVPCARKGGITFNIQGNDYWLLATVMNVGGGGDIAKMWVKGSKTGWISMSHNWGASYQAFAHLGGQCLSFKIQSYIARHTIVAYNLIPPYWTVGMTYQAKVNFR